uniref:PID domain-containing protein n=1 Tax=Strongyloides papillosus TaxID=174720 RepID=A0A0N5BZ25_STREA
MKDSAESKSTNIFTRSWKRLTKRKGKKKGLQLAEEAVDVSDDHLVETNDRENAIPKNSSESSPQNETKVGTNIWEQQCLDASNNSQPFSSKKMDKFDKFRQSIRKSFRLKPKDNRKSNGSLQNDGKLASLSKSTNTQTITSGNQDKASAWQPDEIAVRNGVCSFPVKYLGCTEVFEGRGMNVCESALATLRSKKKKPTKAILYVTGDGLRVVARETGLNLLVDQTIEKVSFCAPDRDNDKGFAYICRDGTTRRWMCHGFHATNDSGDRLSHAVGCAFSICLEKKKKREQDAANAALSPSVFDSPPSSIKGNTSDSCSVKEIDTNFGHGNKAYQSFRRQLSINERIIDPQSAIVLEPTPLKTPSLPQNIIKPRPIGNPALFERQSSLRAPENNLNHPFKRLHSLRNEMMTSKSRNSDYSIKNPEPIWEGDEFTSLNESSQNSTPQILPNFNSVDLILLDSSPMTPSTSNYNLYPSASISNLPQSKTSTNQGTPPELPPRPTSANISSIRKPAVSVTEVADSWLQDTFRSSLNQNSHNEAQLTNSVSLTNFKNSPSTQLQSKVLPSLNSSNLLLDTNSLLEEITKTHIFDSPINGSPMSSTTNIDDPSLLGYRQFRNSMEYNQLVEEKGSNNTLNNSVISPVTTKHFVRTNNSIKYKPLCESSSSFIEQPSIPDNNCKNLDVFGQPVFNPLSSSSISSPREESINSQHNTKASSSTKLSNNESNTSNDENTIKTDSPSFLGYFVGFLLLALMLITTRGSPQHNKIIAKKLLKNYNKKHRPVKSESSPVNIYVQLRITHVESINQKEQAMYLHGQLFTSWKDEYLQWSPEDYNQTSAIYLDAFQIWQPALTLINNADAKGWNIHLGSTPALVSSTGYVILSGIFSFYVTCKFDFSYYPYDTQECPIALTEWIYDVSKVNLSEFTSEQAKPILKLSWDPIRNKSREHAGGRYSKKFLFS